MISFRFLSDPSFPDIVEPKEIDSWRIESGLSSNGLLLPYHLPSESIGAVRNILAEPSQWPWSLCCLVFGDVVAILEVFRCCVPELSTPKTPHFFGSCTYLLDLHRSAPTWLLCTGSVLSYMLGSVHFSRSRRATGQLPSVG